MDVTLLKKENYFSHPNLQVEKPSMEDKDLWLLELPFLSPTPITYPSARTLPSPA